ncbi:type II toxin-antitoxin system death-on-curing family toxin [Hazenella sp. IB182357]|uniref:Type II toxin-antitoxin system death-on-curing family toxin n=1 Tax=Polycladospora coralii TaxID=2771432 RepID=A0A926NBI8_9BACL|nr:type II toxin-antitoxin system death-on-curing family toxin [Polycladospora coralii]MBD1372730.1 type II toxin-antitoxin system death-on-curing family toxin [Polycladospora coralii]MBS7531121.1 type II toxin-antitoxin system death-on-curing family toxin [Polycladospora coralii]
MTIYYLSIYEMIYLNTLLIRMFNQDADHRDKGVLDNQILEAVTYTPQHTLFGKEAYASVPEKAVALLEATIKQKPFSSGNRQTGWCAALTFLQLNGYELQVSTDEQVNWIESIENDHFHFEEMVIWLSDRLRCTV